MALHRPLIAAEIRATLTVAAPLAAANLAQMAMQVTNAVMVGHLGAVPLAAAGLMDARSIECHRLCCRYMQRRHRRTSAAASPAGSGCRFLHADLCWEM